MRLVKIKLRQLYNIPLTIRARYKINETVYSLQVEACIRKGVQFSATTITAKNVAPQAVNILFDLFMSFSRVA